MLKDLLAKIREGLPEDSELRSHVSSAMREADNIIENLKSANSESKDRKLKLREIVSENDELKQTVTERDTNITTLTEENKNLNTFKNEYDLFKAKETSGIREKWSGITKKFKLPETDPLHEKYLKIKDEFIFAEEGKELSVEDLKTNIKKHSLLEKAGLFGAENQSQESYNNDNPKGGGNNSSEYYNPFINVKE